MQYPLLAGELLSISSVFDLVLFMIFLGTFALYLVRMLWLFGSNTFGASDENTIKQNKKAMITSSIYFAGMFVFISWLFFIISILGLDKAGVRGQSQASEFIRQGLEKVDSGDYTISEFGDSWNSYWDSNSSSDPLNMVQ